MKINFQSIKSHCPRRLCRALLNLRKYTDALVYGAKQYGPSQVLFFIQSDQYGPSQVLFSSNRTNMDPPKSCVHPSQVPRTNCNLLSNQHQSSPSTGPKQARAPLGQLELLCALWVKNLSQVEDSRRKKHNLYDHESSIFFSSGVGRNVPLQKLTTASLQEFHRC